MHSQEFTMVEWYRAGAGYREMMDEVEALVRTVAELAEKPVGDFNRLSYREAFQEFGGREPPSDSVEAQRAWINDVEPKLLEPTFVFDYPADQSAFAEIRGAVAERFELYIDGIELANAFSELLDPVELRVRWEKNNAERAAMGREPHAIDERVIDAVSRHPRAGGVALGFDRLLLVLFGYSDIRETQVSG